MEASPLSTSETEDWAEQFDQSLDLQRERIREFLDAQQERLDHAEEELGRRLQQFADELAHDRNEVQQAREEVQQRSERLARETQALEDLKEELAAQRAEWEPLQQRAVRQQEALAEQIREQQDRLDRCRDELLARQAETDAAEATLHEGQQALDLARREHQAELQRQAALQEQLEARQAELASRDEELAARQADTETRRRRIARELKARHAEHLKELEHRHARLQRQDGRQQSELEQQLDDARKEQTESAARAKAAEQREEQLEAELKSLRDAHQRLQQEHADRAEDDGKGAKALKNLEDERDALMTRLAETEDRLAEAQQADPRGESTDEDAQRRYEMAIEDLRELKARNEELQRQLAQVGSSESSSAGAGQALDWEAEKQRILASLESGFDENDEEVQAERLRIEEVIQRTDLIVAEKQRECDELRQLLQDQSTKLESHAVGAAALGKVLDADAVVQEERQRLAEIQEQWREKLRQAEVDISVERAKLARERAQLEERLRAQERQGAVPAGEAADTAEPNEPAPRRWLRRLGLKDTDVEEDPRDRL